MRNSSVALLVVSLTLSACAAGPAPKSGFLHDYSTMVKPGKSDSLLEQRPPADFDVTTFRAVYIEPSQIDIEGMSDQARARLVAVFREALIGRLNGQLPVVERAGPGVLHVRSAIISARKASVPINVITGILGAPMSPTQGGVAAEAEVLDGGSGNRIAALSWARRGAKMKEVGLTYTRLGEARSGLRVFAQRLADLFSPPRSKHNRARKSADPRQVDRRQQALSIDFRRNLAGAPAGFIILLTTSGTDDGDARWAKDTRVTS